MTRIVFVTQHIDPEHPVLAATVPKVRALAERVDEVVVLADAGVPGALPSNCRVKTFRAPSRAARGARFLAALLPELRGASAVVAHMCPIYAVLAAPVARPLRVPVLLWYTQWHASATLRVAERLASRVLTVEQASFPLPSRKVAAIGHGLDPAELTCHDVTPTPQLRLVALGRYSPVKRYDEIVRAVSVAAARGVDVSLVVHGAESNEAERRHRRELELLVDELDVGHRVRLEPGLPRRDALAVLAGADALVSATVRGAADKVVVEAALMCVPTLVPAHAFEALVPTELRYAGDASSLAATLERFARVPPAERQALGAELRARALAGHTVASWADAVVRLASA